MELRTLLLIIPAMSSSLSFGQLSGTYTVGGDTPDYATLTDAVDDLLAQGAAGDVVLNLRPGTYSGQYHITAIPGTPGFITIRSETDDANDVILTHQAAGAADNYIFEIEQQPNVNLRALTLHPLGADHARAVHFFNNCDGLNIWRCILIGSAATSGTDLAERILIRSDQSAQTSAENSDEVGILDNTFEAGSKAIVLEFQNTAGVAQGLQIARNVVAEQTAGGISVVNASGRISNNRITTNAGEGYVGLETSNFAGNVQVMGNVVQANASGDCTGLKFGNTPATSGNLLANNMISARGTNNVRGMVLYDLKGTQVFHNTVLVADGPVLQSITFEHTSINADAQDTEVRNNVLANTAGGTVLFSVIAGNLGTEDYNDLFTTGHPLADLEGIQYDQLPEYQVGTGQGAGSVSIDPAFPFLPDLHLATCALDGRCPPIPTITDDIDGEPRDLVATDPGADEYSPLTVSFLGPDITILDTDLPWTLNASQFVTYVWSTTETTPGIVISSGGTYSTTVTDMHGCVLQDSIVVQVDINTGVIAQASSSGLCPVRLVELV